MSTPTTDLPSGDPIPMPSSSSSSSSPPKPAPFPLKALLAAPPAHLDAFLAHLNRCLATPSDIDTVLLFVCYTSRLAASGLGALSRPALQRSAREWIALVASLPPKTTILFTAAPATATAAVGGKQAVAAAAGRRLLLLSQRLKALSTLLSEARMILRLWGLLGMYFWGRSLVLQAVQTAKKKNTKGGEAAAEEPAPLATAIAWTQLLSCIVFQSLENGAYLSSRGIMGWSPATQASAWKWSARFWGVYVGAELGRLAADAVAKSNDNKDKDGKEGAVALAEDAAWRKQVARNLSWAPLTVHWGMDKGFVSEGMIGLLGSIPGVIQMRDLWRRTAV